MAEKKSGEKMVQVVLERHVPKLGAAGMAIEVTESVARSLCEYRNVHNGTHLVKTRTARPFDEKVDLPIVGNMTVSEMRQAGIKNVTEVPESFKRNSAASDHLNSLPPKGEEKVKAPKAPKEPKVVKGSKKKKNKAADTDADTGNDEGQQAS